MPRPETALGGDDVRFRDTLWSTVLQARDRRSPGGRAALDRLMRRYWKPVYFFVRRRGRDIEDAKDLTQGFFTSLLERDALRGVEPGRGKFRTFLLTLLERFVSNEREHAGAKKRGGGRAALALDATGAEAELARGAAESAEAAYERAWAAGVLARAFEALRADPHFEVVRLRLVEGLAPAAIGKRLGIGAKDVDNALQRGKAKLRERVLAEVKEEVGAGESAEVEMRKLLAACGGSPS